MNQPNKFISFLALCVAALGFVSTSFAHNAKVAKVTGVAEVQVPGSPAQRLMAGTSVPEGAVITTAPGGQVFLEVFPGGVATIAPESTVVVEKLALEQQGGLIVSQEALLNLKKGNVVSALDPKKKSINKYGVRTPKGVAAARGTVYTVTVGENSYTVTTTLSGQVTIMDSATGATVTIDAGGVSVNGGESQSGSQLDAETSAIVTQAASIAAAAMATVATDTSGAFDPGAASVAQGELAAVLTTITQTIPQAMTQAVAAAAAAAPSLAQTITNTVVNAGGDSAQVTQAVNAGVSGSPVSSDTPPPPAVIVTDVDLPPESPSTLAQ